ERPRLESVPDWPVRMRLFNEREVTGTFVSGHPLDPYIELVEAYKKQNPVPPDLAEQGIRLFAGVIVEVKRRTTRKGDPMWFVRLNDGAEDVEMAVFARTHERYGAFVQEGGAVAALAKEDGGRYAGKLTMEAVLP